MNLRTKLAYCLAFRYGSEAYLNSECFVDTQQFAKFVCNFYSDKRHQGKSPVVIHHDKKYKGKMPIWAAVELLSFGTLSRVYANLRPDLQKQVSKTFLSDADTFVIGSDFLRGWFKSLVELRNACAHFDRLYNKRFISPPKLFKEHKE
ncbi:MAG: Abi family protein, partial [Proteocatella sp.]